MTRRPVALWRGSLFQVVVIEQIGGCLEQIEGGLARDGLFAGDGFLG